MAASEVSWRQLEERLLLLQFYIGIRISLHNTKGEDILVVRIEAILIPVLLLEREFG